MNEHSGDRFCIIIFSHPVCVLPGKVVTADAIKVINAVIGFIILLLMGAFWGVSILSFVHSLAVHFS